jgi:hypothetical protein
MRKGWRKANAWNGNQQGCLKRTHFKNKALLKHSVDYRYLAVDWSARRRLLRETAVFNRAKNKKNLHSPPKGAKVLS